MNSGGRRQEVEGEEEVEAFERLEDTHPDSSRLLSSTSSSNSSLPPAAAPPPPWWPPREDGVHKLWEVVAPCRFPPPDVYNREFLLACVPPPEVPTLSVEPNARSRPRFVASSHSTAGSEEERRGERGREREREKDSDVASTNALDDGGDNEFVLSGEFLKQLALNEVRRKQRKKEERRRDQEKEEKEALEGGLSLQSLLERRRRFEASDDLKDVLKRRQEVRDFRRDIYGSEGLSELVDIEDSMNDDFDARCSKTRAPAWPIPTMG